MPRIAPLDHDHATGRARELLDELAARGGEPGPMVRAMANAPALLRGYLDFTRAMKRAHVDRRVSERIALAVHEWLGCEYCLAAHSRAARELGLSDTDIALARQGTATDAKVAALVAFGQQVIAAPEGDLRRAGRRAARARLHRRAARRSRRPGLPAAADRRVQPRRRHPPTHHHERYHMSTHYLAWAAAVGAAGCGRCPNAV